MERRDIAAGAAFTFFAAGAGAVTAAATVGTANSYFDPLFYGGVLALLVSFAAVLYLFFTASAGRPKVAGDTFNNNGNNFGHMGPVNNYEDRSAKRRLHDLLSSIDRRIPSEARSTRELVIRMEPHDVETLNGILSETGAGALVRIKGYGRSFSESVLNNGSLGTTNAVAFQQEVILVFGDAFF